MSGIETAVVILVLLLVVIIATWASLYVYMTRCRRQYIEQATAITQQVDTAAIDLLDAEHTALQTTPEDPPPYGPLTKDLLQRLQHARESLASCTHQLSVLEISRPVTSPAMMERLLSIPAQVRGWHDHRDKAIALAEQMLTMQKLVEGAQQQADQIRRLPLGVAGRVRSLISAIERTVRLCQGMQQSGVRGEGLDSLMATVRTHRTALDELPEYFRQGGQDLILSRATQDSTRDVWQRLSNIEKPVYDALRRGQQWQSQYDEAKNMIASMQVEVSALERILKELPISIDAHEYAARYAETRDSAHVLENTWRAPEVNHLLDLSNAATGEITASQKIAAEVMLLQKTYQGLEQALQSNTDAIARIGTVLAALAQSPQVPVRCDASITGFERLRTLQKEIGDLHVTRNRTQLDADLDKALDLGLQCGALEAKLNDTRDRHGQLKTLLTNPEFSAPGEWFKDAATLHVEVMAYAPENWPEQDRVEMFKADAAELLQIEKSLQPLLSGKSINEDDIASWVNGATKFVQDRRVMQARVESMAQTLQRIQRAEKMAQLDVSQSLGSLARLDKTMIQTPSSASVSKAWSVLSRQWENGQRLAEALEDRKHGMVEDKAAEITKWVGACAQSVRGLLDAVQAEADEMQRGLTEQVNSLLAIAPFDNETSMNTARELLSEIPPRAIGGKGPSNVAEMAQSINAAFERRSSLSEALDDLTYRISAQVDPRVVRMEEVHAVAWDKLQELQALQKQVPRIPQLPIICDSADRQLESFHQSENLLSDLNQSGHTVKSVLGRLDSLIDQFQHVANEGATVQADIEAVIDRLGVAWDELGRWTRSLKRFRSSVAGDVEAITAVDAKLDDIDHRFADISRRNKGRPLPIEQACRELESLISATRTDMDVLRDSGVETIGVQDVEGA